MKKNPRVQRKEEESQLMLEDWCWNLKKVSAVFSLRTDHYFLRREGWRQFLGGMKFYSPILVVHLLFCWAIACAGIFFIYINNSFWIVESTCSVSFFLWLPAPLDDFAFQQFLLCRNFFGNCQSPPPPPSPLKKVMVLSLGFACESLVWRRWNN